MHFTKLSKKQTSSASFYQAYRGQSFCFMSTILNICKSTMFLMWRLTSSSTRVVHLVSGVSFPPADLGRRINVKLKDEQSLYIHACFFKIALIIQSYAMHHCLHTSLEYLQAFITYMYIVHVNVFIHPHVLSHTHAHHST